MGLRLNRPKRTNGPLLWIVGELSLKCHPRGGMPTSRGATKIVVVAKSGSDSAKGVCLTLRACRDHFESLIYNTWKKHQNLAESLVRRYAPRNIPGANQFSRARSVVFSEFEFLTTRQSEADPMKCQIGPARVIRRGGFNADRRSKPLHFLNMAGSKRRACSQSG
jgi:hypothetical protein